LVNLLYPLEANVVLKLKSYRDTNGLYSGDIFQEEVNIWEEKDPFPVGVFPYRD